jgi:hypothetical protein
MKKVLLTTTAIVGLSAPAFAADPTAVSDQPYFHHAHPMTWSGSMSITLSNPSSSDVDTASEKAGKRDFLFDFLNGAGGAGQEAMVGAIGDDASQADANATASNMLTHMASMISTHASYTLSTTTAAGTASATAHVSAVEDVIDDFLGGSHSEAMDVVVEAWGNSTVTGSNETDLRADIDAFAASRDDAAESVEKTASINTTAS